MKAHEETWEVRAGDTGQHREGDVFLAGSPRAVLRPFGNVRYREGVTAEDRARLAAAAPEMARLLLELEWTGLRTYQYEGGGDPACPVCDVEPGTPHADDCKLIAVLRKAGVIADKETR